MSPDASLEYYIDGAGPTTFDSGDSIPVTVPDVGIPKVMTIEVTSIKDIKKVNTVSITPRGSSDATLSSLTATAGTFIPGFSSNVTSYTLSVPNTYTSVNVTPVKNTSTATLRYRVDGGTWSITIPVIVNGLVATVAKILEIEVTAQDGITVKTYTISIIRNGVPGSTWVEVTVSGAGAGSNWTGITSSSDGTKLAAVVKGGYIYTSADSGATWTKQTNSGSRNWQCITSSSDGTKLAAGVYGGYIYTSADSGVSWTPRTSAGSRNWQGITVSSDGTKFAAIVNGSDKIYISHP